MTTQTNTLTLKFWGVRGSHPVPGDSAMQFGGNTPCIEITARNGQRTHTIILDAGTGIIPLGRKLAACAGQSGSPLEATLLFTHLHHDHTQGFPFFVPTFLPTARLNIVVPDIYEFDPTEVLTSVMASPKFPVAFHQTGSVKTIHRLRETGVALVSEEGVVVHPYAPVHKDPNAVTIRAMRSYAHPQHVLVYRIEWGGTTIVHATDTEGYVHGDQRLSRFVRGADVLIHDAQYTEEHYLGLKPGLPATQGYGHSTPRMACEVARTADVGQLFLFHHDPNYDDKAINGMVARARQYFPNTQAAREGLEITLSAGSKIPALRSTAQLAVSSNQPNI